jgi:hypothetical protein
MMMMIGRTFLREYVEDLRGQRGHGRHKLRATHLAAVHHLLPHLQQMFPQSWQMLPQLCQMFPEWWQMFPDW